MQTNSNQKRSKRARSRAPHPNQASHANDNAERRIENRRGRRGARQYLRSYLQTLR